MPARKFHHATIREPSDFTAGSFRTIKPSKAIDDQDAPRFVIGRLKGQTTTTTQAVLLPDYWTPRRVHEWLSASGRRPIRVAWANPDTDRDRLRSALERTKRYAMEAIADLEDGNTSGAIVGMRAAAAAANSAALHAGVRLRANPGAEQYTSAQTSIREAIIHLVQADKNIGAGQSAAALEAVESAADHIDKALERLDPETYGTGKKRNVCEPPDRNPPAAGAQGTTPQANEPQDNPFKRDTFALRAMVTEASRRGLQGVEWKHPTAGWIFTTSAKPETFAAFKTRQAARIKAAGGRSVKWHPCRGPACKRKAKNPAAPRQLVRLGDILELRMADGSTHKWARGERAMLVSPGVEKSSAGRASIIIAGVKSARPAPRGPHKTSERTHETWHGALPTGAKVADIPGPDEFQRAAGRVKAIVYYSLKWHDRASYIHEFKADALPGLFAGPRGTYEIRGGKFRVTARGIVN